MKPFLQAFGIVSFAFSVAGTAFTIGYYGKDYPKLAIASGVYIFIVFVIGIGFALRSVERS